MSLSGSLTKRTTILKIIKSTGKTWRKADFLLSPRGPWSRLSQLFSSSETLRTALKHPLEPSWETKAVKRRGFIWDGVFGLFFSFSQNSLKTGLNLPRSASPGSSGCLSGFLFSENMTRVPVRGTLKSAEVTHTARYYRHTHC